MADLDQLRAELGDVPVVTDPAKVQQKSRDFYWYSPVLKRQLEHVCADLVIEPRNEAEVIRALAACHRQRVPVTVRGGGTGNYGQAMPLKGGVVLDLQHLDRVVDARRGLPLALLDDAPRICDYDTGKGLPLGGSMDPPPKELAEIYVAIWQKAVDTQMHFNEMSVKSRQLGLAFVAAALGIGVVLLSRGSDFAVAQQLWILKFELHVSVIIVLAAAFALAAVRILDLNVYHKMLRGAVTFGEDFEENYMKQIFLLEKGMTQAISHFSRFQDASVMVEGTKYHYQGCVRIPAEVKIRQFYRNSIWVLLIAAIVLLLLTGHFDLITDPTWMR